ncbi:MAG: DUF1338 family protein, partial [Pseudomonadota bacterium]
MPTSFFDALWDDYIQLSPRAVAIRDLFGGKAVRNDHVAFRTFAYPSIAIADLEVFLFAMGYQRHSVYQFADKHLSACAYTPSSNNDPLIFLSELHIDQLPFEAGQIVLRLLSRLDAPPQDESVFYSGRLWPLLSWPDYQILSASSEYAAWLALHGFHANHFTIALHSINQSLPAVVAHLR